MQYGTGEVTASLESITIIAEPQKPVNSAKFSVQWNLGSQT
jgi:hypothetical protein